MRQKLIIRILSIASILGCITTSYEAAKRTADEFASESGRQQRQHVAVDASTAAAAASAVATFSGAAQASSPSRVPSGPISIVHPCTDYGFKRAMKTPEVVMGFLNTILKLEGDQMVSQVTYLDGELLSNESLGRHFTVDVLCETVKGRRFLLEMQNDYRADYATKALVELCRLIADWDAKVVHQDLTQSDRSQFRSGQTHTAVKTFWKDIEQAIVIAITNKRFPDNAMKARFPGHTVMEPEIINTYRIVHDQHPTRPLGDLDVRVILIMLSNFNVPESALSTDLDRWLYAFKECKLERGVTRIPAYKQVENAERAAGDTAGLQMFYAQLDREKVSMTGGDLGRFEEELAEVNAVLDEKRIEGREEGKVEGRAEGRVEGEKAARIETVRQMLAHQMDINLITEITKLERTEIEALAREIHSGAAATPASSYQ
jgi:hypothetical protein